MQLLVLGGQGHSANVYIYIYRCMIIFRELLWVGKQISCSKFNFMTIRVYIDIYLQMNVINDFSVSIILTIAM